MVLHPAAPIPPEPIDLDLRVGGVWRQKMVVDDDTEYVAGGIYLEIVPGERLVFIWGASDGWPKIEADRPEAARSSRSCSTLSVTRRRWAFQVSLPDDLSDDQVREWLATGMREGWGDTIDRLVASFAAVPI